MKITKLLLQRRKINQERSRGFSLIELSIVILIISILISGALTVSVKKINNIKEDLTRDHIDKIYKALGHYVSVNGKLPCPASIIEVKTNSTSYGAVVGADGDCKGSGVYASTTSTELVYGMVPVQILGLGSDVAQDGFGSKIAYIVDRRFTDVAQFGLAASNSGLMTVQELTSNDLIQTNADDIILSLISHGANEAGAFNSNSSTQNSRSSDIDELNNDLGTITTPNYDDTLIYSSARSEVFDDIVFSKSRNSLVSDFGDLNLIVCEPGATNNDDVTYDTETMTWPQAKYGQIVAATGSTPGPSTGECPSDYTATVDKPTKRCGAFGVWDVGAINPCVENGDQTGGGGADLSCTGGTESIVNGKIVKTFTADGTLDCAGDGTISYLIVAGGGGGGGVIENEGGGGGGGGGGVVTGSYAISDGEVISITVGAGGAGGTSHATDATAGGAGIASFLGGIASATGGSGGSVGGGYDTVLEVGDPYGGASGSGNDPSQIGGNPQAGDHGGGGGGASMEGVGGSSPETGEHDDHEGGAGANGTTSAITGTSIVYGSGGGGGGGGNDSQGNPGAGGADSGGTGNTQGTPATDGVVNRGGGGGGGGKVDGDSGSGGKGVVIVSYEQIGGGGGGTLSCTGGSESFSGGNTIRTFSSDGSLVCTGEGTLTYLAVGAGGGGGGVAGGGGKGGDGSDGGGGGGGGGGVSTGTHYTADETLTIVIGVGGAGGEAANGSSGTSSSISGSLAVTSTGGGGGVIGGNDDGYGGVNGTGNSVTINSGGDPQAEDKDHGAGGGGASMAANGGNAQESEDAPHAGGDGADGTASSITGSSIVYGSGGGGGGGGGSSEGDIGLGGSDSGGDGGNNAINAEPGIVNRGGGGGGGADNSNAGDGGDGVIIFSYTTP